MATMRNFIHLIIHSGTYLYTTPAGPCKCFVSIFNGCSQDEHNNPLSYNMPPKAPLKYLILQCKANYVMVHKCTIYTDFAICYGTQCCWLILATSVCQSVHCKCDIFIQYHTHTHTLHIIISMEFNHIRLWDWELQSITMAQRKIHCGKALTPEIPQTLQCYCTSNIFCTLFWSYASGSYILQFVFLNFHVYTCANFWIPWAFFGAWYSHWNKKK